MGALPVSRNWSDNHLMSDGISIDIGSALPYVVDRIASLFGKDARSTAWKARIDRMTKMASEHASEVQCIGMPNPVPISDIYQPTRIEVPKETEPYLFDQMSLESMLKTSDSVIIAGPGRGKTTLLHWTYIELCRSKELAPLLFTLRWPDATKDLCEFVEDLHTGRPMPAKGQRIVMLVDGYDEIGEEDRRRVSQALLLFKALDIGYFCLTCRSFYEIYDLKAPICHLAEFTETDALRFIQAYSRLCGRDLQPQATLDELYAHGFQDFATHPLMLTLVCILKTGPSQQIPRRAIGLIRRAIETLTFRWDEAKYIRRSSDVPVDGEERVRCLMRIAYEMHSIEGPYSQVENSVRRHLHLIQVKGVCVRELLTEIAQWYGILIPATADSWTFVHRTIHDFLAARFWVESGGFSHPSHWDLRAAYATCLLPDGTFNIRRMLDEPEVPQAFYECLYNQAAFDTLVIAGAVADFVERTGRFVRAHEPAGICAHLNDDFYELCTQEFLERLLLTAGTRHSDSGEAIAWYVIAEFQRRRLKVPQRLLVNRMRILYQTALDIPVHVQRSRAIHEFRLRDAVSC